MKHLFLLVVCLCLTTPAFAENKFNPMTGEYEVVPHNYSLQYNAPAGHWTYAPPNTQLELNRSTMEFEYPGQGSHRPPSTGTAQDFVPPEYQQYQRASRAQCLAMRLAFCE